MPNSAKRQPPAPPAVVPAPTDPVEDGLRSAIRAHPDDMAPRLIYADWLDEHGEPRLAAYFRRPLPPPLPPRKRRRPPVAPPAGGPGS